MSRPIKPELHSNIPSAPPAAPSPPAEAPSPGYTDFILRSTAPSSQTGLKYNIMKFAAMSDRSIDPSNEAAFPRPVRLNRKDPRTVRRMNDEEIERINRGGGEDEVMEDGTVVKGEEGEDTKGKGKKVREEMDVSLVGTGTSGIKPTVRSKGNMFKKKTNRVFVSSEEARRLKREEWMPWVLEDATTTQRWIGRLEGGTGEQQKSTPTSSSDSTNAKLSAAARSTAAANAKGTGMSGWRPPAIVGDAGAGGSCYVAFVFPEDGKDFKVYPTNRWYKFGQGPKYVTLGTEDAEEEYTRQEKKQASERWIMQRRAAESAAAVKLASGSATPLAPASPGPSSSTQSSNARARLQEAARQAALQIPGSRAMRMGSGAKGGGGANNRPDQSEDEFDFEEDFQDDEEGIAKIDDMADEDELKELNRRIKNEMRGVERIGMSSNAAAGEEDDEEDGVELDKEGKTVRKLFKRIEKNDVYDSDGEEENPYASQEDSSSDDSTTSTPADSTKPKPKSLHRSSHSSRTTSRPTSRTGSPAPGIGTNAGAMLAKRATSPSGRRSTPGSRSNSPGRESSPGTGVSGKRRRGDGMDGNESDGSKRRKAPPTPDLPLPSSTTPNGGVGSPSSALITEGDIIALFKSKATSLQTKDVLAHFKRALKGNPANKAAIGGLLMSVASLVDGNLILRPGL